MFRNYLVSALRNLSRNRLHTAITTASLAVGFAAALIAAMIWRYETTHDRFWPNAERIYVISQWDWPADKPEGLPTTSDAALSGVGPLAEQTISGVEKMTRMSVQTLGLSRDQTTSEETVRWADPDFFEVFPVKVLAGDLSTALSAANSIVLTEALARKYFGDTPPIGQTLSAVALSGDQGERIPVRVSAVIADLPQNTHMEVSGFVSGVTAGSALSDPMELTYSYLLARPGVSPKALERGLAALPPQPLEPDARPHLVQYRPLALEKVYLKPEDYGAFEGGQASRYSMNSGSYSLLTFSAILAGFILGVAAINFITLMTARGAGRAVEVGVRKACGARRRDLVAQFIGEALLLAALALVAAFAMGELLTPMVRVVSGRQVQLNYLGDIGLLGALAGFAFLIAALAGFYPALALAAYRPATVLKGGLAKTPGSARLRQILITLQFIPLVLLAIVAMTLSLLVHQKEDSARAMLKGDPLMIEEACTPTLKAGMEALPGVISVVCTPTWGWRSSPNAMGPVIANLIGRKAAAQNTQVALIRVGEVSPETVRFHYGKALAGRLFDEAGDDSAGVLINATAASDLGYRNPSDAVGQRVDLPTDETLPPRSFTILGVLPDRWKPGFEFTLYALPGAVVPAPASQSQKIEKGIGVRLTEANRPATVAAINQLWANTGAIRPMNQRFYSDKIAEQVAKNYQMVTLLNMAIGVGMAVASLGLFGLAAFLAEQRTKEIGVRKAMGAGRGVLLRMLLFQFARPVLIANLIVCPPVVLFLWLSQIGRPLASRITVGPGVFAAVLVGSLLIALLATFVHAWRVTGARPVTALRYE